MCKKLSLILIILVALGMVLAGCDKANQTEIYFGENLLFVYQHRTIKCDYIIYNYSLDIDIKGESAEFETYVKSHDTYMFSHKTADGKECMYILNNGTYYIVYFIDGVYPNNVLPSKGYNVTPRKGYMRYHIETPMASLRVGSDPMYSFLGFSFPSSLIEADRIFTSDDSLACDYDFLCNFYRMIPEIASIDEENKSVVVTVNPGFRYNGRKIIITCENGYAKFALLPYPAA